MVRFSEWNSRPFWLKSEWNWRPFFTSKFRSRPANSRTACFVKHRTFSFRSTSRAMAASRPPCLWLLFSAEHLPSSPAKLLCSSAALYLSNVTSWPIELFSLVRWDRYWACKWLPSTAKLHHAFYFSSNYPLFCHNLSHFSQPKSHFSQVTFFSQFFIPPMFFTPKRYKHYCAFSYVPLQPPPPP